LPATEKPRIYISSTFFDLEDHRTVLNRVLESTECFDIVRMENYGTRSKPPLEKCLEDVDSCEYYILLLGNRYGYIPAGQKYSITNREYKKAIGDDNMDIVAGPPDRRKCVLPFIMDPQYKLRDEILARMEKEDAGDPELRQRKAGYLEELKNRIRTDFVVDVSHPFTTPDELTAQVMAALVHQLVKDKKLSLVNKIHLSGNIIYRCNRERPRSEFLRGNLQNRNFYRAFIVHGENEDLPILFSNNISTFELQVRKNIRIRNLDDYAYTEVSKFSEAFILKIYQETFSDTPTDLSFEGLAARITGSDLTCLTVTVEINYRSWKNKYTSLLAGFFDMIKKANERLQATKSVYFLINVVYSNRGESLGQHPGASIVLDRLQDVSIGHIKEWLMTYYFQSRDPSSQNESEIKAERIIGKYFPEYRKKKGISGLFARLSGKDTEFSMEDTIRRLETIVRNFNNNTDQDLINL
jgi:hypothetical protein